MTASTFERERVKSPDLQDQLPDRNQTLEALYSEQEFSRRPLSRNAGWRASPYQDDDATILCVDERTIHAAVHEFLQLFSSKQMEGFKVRRHALQSSKIFKGSVLSCGTFVTCHKAKSTERGRLL